MGDIFKGLKPTEINTDYLTGLFNRRGLNDVWDSLPVDTRIHCIYIDVDNFKLVNDIYGHSKGDELLIYIGNLLNKIFESQIVVRMGGDEFVIICDGTKKPEELEHNIPILQNALVSGEFDSNVESLLSFSIGVVYNQSVSAGLNEILLQCDEAMYHVKRNGKGNYVVYDRIKQRVEEQKAIKDRALLALEKEEIEILLQPVIYLQTSDVCAAEVVLRWKFPGLGMLPEEKFMPVFHQYGIIRQIDAHIFEQVCIWKNQWKDTPYEYLDVYVRISGMFLLQKSGMDHICDCLKKYQVNAAEIKISIDEKDFLDNKESLYYAVKTLINMGFQIAIDNFGSSSPLMVLQNIPSHILKLDPTLLSVESEKEDKKRILRNVISLGRDLQRYIVGQNIENANQTEMFANYGAQFGTGNFYGDAMDETSFRKKYINRLFYLKNKRPVKFSFDNHLWDAEHEYEGKCFGGKIAYSTGVVDGQKSLAFPGGDVKENVVYLPNETMHSNSYSICFWINPEIEQAWTSVIYITFTDGFMSLVPYNGVGAFCFRIKDDREPNIWTDLFCRQAMPGQWSYICATYDAITGIAKLYFNGLLVGSLDNVPDLKVPEKVMLGGDEYQNSFKGKLAGLEIYHYVISADCIQDKFQNYQREESFLGTEGKK